MILKRNKAMYLSVVAGFIIPALIVAMASGQVIVPPTPANQLSVLVSANVTYNSSSALYTYTYTLTNADTSEQKAWMFALQLDSGVENPTSPAGWTFAQHDDRPIVSWAATDTGLLPPDFIDDGNLPPSPFSIVPGETLTGFELDSPDPPGNVPFFIQGETKLAQVATDTGDLPMEGVEIRDFTENSYTGFTVGPVPLDQSQFYTGGRRPAVDGFLVFLNLANDEVRTSPVGIIIKFAINGESVDQSTFHATLNGTDVTGSFLPGSQSGELVGIFHLGTSPLVTGRNVLVTGVNGIVPETTRTATDVDRITFTVGQ
ncbi:MAG: hypothetical protein C4567_03730 [Deltaproteobacteria bacterium]|nr:MAG: hypothetical protein C4567_03730 [Deltaproteobacteria bacterium]